MTKHFCDICGTELADNAPGTYFLNIGQRMVDKSEKQAHASGHAMLCAEDGARIIAQLNIKMEKEEW